MTIQHPTKEATSSILRSHTIAKRLQAEIKAKESELKTLKEMLQKFMGDAVELHDPYGVCLATYMPHEESRFNLEAFKTDKPKIYQAYLVTTIKRPFVLK